MAETTSNPQTQTNDILAALKELLALAHSSLDGLQRPPALRHQVLLGVTGGACQHASGIADLATTGNVWSAEVILRTLLEGWITARWVVEDNTDTRAKTYVARSRNETLKFFRRIRKLAQDNPNDEQHFLHSAGFSSSAECDHRIDELASDILNGLSRLPSLEQRARDLGPEVERNYASLYSFLLSEQVHAGAGSTFRFFLEPSPDAEQTGAARMRRIIVTAYVVFLDLLRMTSDTLDRPSSESLARFEQIFEQIRSSA